MKNITYLLVFVMVTLSSCGPNYIFEEEKSIANDNWAYDQMVAFEVDIQDTTAIYNLYLDIDHSTAYSNQNLYIMIHTGFPGGEEIKERVSIDFADKSGKWFGDCNSEACNLRVNIQRGAFFNALGKHTFKVEQYMRIDPLPGIKNIALRIEDTGERR